MNSRLYKVTHSLLMASDKVSNLAFPRCTEIEGNLSKTCQSKANIPVLLAEKIYQQNPV